jgi:hypothetical protein
MSPSMLPLSAWPPRGRHAVSVAYSQLSLSPEGRFYAKHASMSHMIFACLLLSAASASLFTYHGPQLRLLFHFIPIQEHLFG